MLKLWGRVNSSNVQKVLWLCEELNIPYDRTEAGMQFGVVNEPAYRKMNPNGRVPTIDDEGFVLWESNAIVRYLAAKHAPNALYPADLKVRADADRWMDWATSTLGGVIVPVFWSLVRTPAEKRDMTKLAADVKALGDVMGALEQGLQGRKYVAGDAFSIGDIPVGINTYRFFALDIARPSLPNVEAWYKRLCERPAYQKWIMKPLT